MSNMDALVGYPMAWCDTHRAPWFEEVCEFANPSTDPDPCGPVVWCLVTPIP